ncbi:c-type cytochrome [Pseudoxanthomonas composti]|uniref:C-type cytochrome n=2 Tax=Pseudoxanthomonas composti TaxID=2137479 RepID=A0A4Q1JWI7_9GAMM|nr:c-type cytochrome [Pseudoxanthomonas composti]
MRTIRFASLAATLGLALALPVLADEAEPLHTAADLSRLDGAGIYTQVCQGCHMADGKGARQVGYYPGFVDNPTLVSPQYVALTVMQGRKNMPAFGRGEKYANDMRNVGLTDKQIAEVTNYLRTHFGNHYQDNLSASDVAALRGD